MPSDFKIDDIRESAYRAGYDAGSKEAVAAFARDLAEKVAAMPTARVISQWDLVSRKAVLRLLNAGVPQEEPYSVEPTATTYIEETPRVPQEER